MDEVVSYRSNVPFSTTCRKTIFLWKRPKELSELEQLRLENKHLKQNYLYGESIWKSKGLKPETVVTLWRNVQTKITVKDLCNVLELPRSTFYRWLQRTEDLKDDIEEK